MPITPQDISVFPEEEETPFTLLTLDHATILQHRKKNTSLSLPFGSDAPSVTYPCENPMTSTPAQRQALRPLRLPSLISLPPASLESPSQHGATTSMSEGKSTPPLPWASSALDPHNPFVDNFERPISRGSSLEEYQPHVFPQQYTSDLHWPSVRSSPLSVLSEPFQHSPEDNPSCVPYRVPEHLDIPSSTLPTYYMVRVYILGAPFKYLSVPASLRIRCPLTRDSLRHHLMHPLQDQCRCPQ
ncbi:uncharacterized protein EI90DRAFT_3052864 [Cantharellus anzutake]|uniref:uncharacterized protein n=1 Tax=Cantharellus anzutake TaxID=1750568 RepID=UPI001907577A|nr:uncharacterized protein EI90DRAFT_3052864 [Cantharellus anzutake]KAF8333068.1 hypothetical protein EI90DRAFT_3052864 [Cantharellus anzutake]